MTEVKITNVPGYCRVQIKGHAGYGFNHHLPVGNDIVCAPISILGQTVAQRILQMSEEKKLGIKELTVKEALIDIRVVPKAEYRNELDVTIKTIVTGFELLAKAHPSYINLGWEI